MKAWLAGFWNDPGQFAATMRAMLFAVGELPSVVDFGAAGGELFWVGKVLQIAALMVKAGDKNVR